jgi:hypothetical protein
VLAALVLIGIVLPVAMRGMSLALAAAGHARHTAEATSLAEAKLNELITYGEWTAAGASGDFGADWPDYQWKAQSYARDFGLTEVIVQVIWTERSRERSLNIATLVHESDTGALP